MGVASTTPAATLGAGAGGGWLWGPRLDLLLGAGAGYVLSIPPLVLLGLAGVSSWPVAAAALFALLVSGPHYGATILRVYDRREDRRRYALFAVWTTLLLGALFAAGLRSPLLGSLLVTLYATWSPWHFSGQNYGLALMFLHRRGVAVEPSTKRLIYASFVLSCALSLLVLHGERSVLTYASVPIARDSVYRFLSLGLPRGLVQVLAPATALAYALALAGAAALLLRRARPRDLGPAAWLVLTQALWFAVPGALSLFANALPQGLAFTVVWISAAHGVQYLWVTSYYARREDPSLRLGPYFARALLAGSAVTIFPALVFAPGLLGSVPWDVGLAILLFSVVNLHHFVLDGAIWKLRDGRVAKLLLRSAESDAPAATLPAPPRSGFRPAMAALGIVSLAVAGFDVWEREVGVNRAGGDLDRVLRAAERLAWIGRDAPGIHTQVARILARSRRPDEAAAEYRRSLELYPTAEAWVGLGELYAAEKRWEQASKAFASALELEPDHAPALAHSGRAWLELGRPDLARDALERARALAPRNPQIERQLRRAIAAEAAKS
jgi:tetratricopeptide (TPR) repeat protein